MAKTNIEWSDLVWNPTTGCDKISQGCKNCYAEIMHKRLALMNHPKYMHHPFLGGAHEHESSIAVPFKFTKKPKKVFVNSMSDLFHKDISVEFIAKCYAVMFLNPHLTFQILTKRPDRRKQIFESEEFYEYLWKYCNQYHDKYIKSLEQEMYYQIEIKELFPLKNIWEGTSVEDKDNLHRIDILRETKAHIRFLSLEPLLEDLGVLNLTGIHQVIVGGESGHHRRPFNLQWAYNILHQCKAQNVPFFFKQIDKVNTNIPLDLRVREFPVGCHTEPVERVSVSKKNN